MVKRQNKKSEYTLKPFQVKKVFAVVSWNFRDRCLVKSFYYAGLRRMEAMKLDVRDVNYERGWIHVREGKFGKERTVLVVDDEFLSDLKILSGGRKQGFIFTGAQGSQLSTRGINWIMEKVSKLSEVAHPDPRAKNLNPHLFRHSYARWLKNQSFSVEYIQNFLGHDSFKTTFDEYGTMSLDDAEAEAIKRGFRHSDESIKHG